MEKCYILIDHNNETEVIAALQAFANLYGDQSFTKNIECYYFEPDALYVVELLNIEKDFFLYAVNYLRYPETRAKFTSVLGYEKDVDVMYFVPKEDDEYDNCYTVDSSGNCTKHQFDGAELSVENDERYLPFKIDIETLKHVVSIEGIKPKKKGFMSWLFG